MAQHDYALANDSGAIFRTDLNAALAAIVSQNSGATEPSTTYAYQWWADTTTGLLKLRNAANAAWITVGTLASAYLGLLPAADGTTSGTFSVGEALALAGDVTPSQITADQNNYAPTGAGAATTLRLSSDASRSITGMTGGQDGLVRILINVGAYAITLKDESASSTAANRFALDADVTLQAEQTAVLRYDATDSRWRILSGPSPVAGSTTHKQVTDSTDITLADIASSYGNFGSSFSLTIPSSGFLEVDFAGRLRNDAAGFGRLYVGLRIGTTNYWPGSFNGNGTTVRSEVLAAYDGTSGHYTETTGGTTGYGTVGTVRGLNIVAAGLPTGAQTVQLIVARSTVACSLRGTTTPSRVGITVRGAS